jgi:2-phospho-L-lactate/phosphoenolpyruvate guanylyltransferase
MMPTARCNAEDAIWAIVPFKGFEFAKQRLSPFFTPEFRRSLTMAMLEDVLDALVDTPGIQEVLLVTRDRAASRLAHERGATAYEERSIGLNEAVMEACVHLHGRARAGVVVVPADIPGVRVAELQTIAATLRGGAEFVIAPSHDRGGSNAIAMRRPGCIPFCYGTDSFVRHLDVAHGHGILATVLDLPGIGLDIDTPHDCQLFLDRPSSTRTWTLLAEQNERDTAHGHVDGSLRCDKNLTSRNSITSSKRR